MQIARPITSKDGVRDETLVLQTQYVERAIQTMHTHLQEVLTLEDLASVAGLSPSHFHRVFCRLIGVPPGEFLAALRFQTARRLLVGTSLSVTDICFEVGYTSTGSFTSRFTQLVGLSPRMLRRRAHAFEPLPPVPVEYCATSPSTMTHMTRNNVLRGRIYAPETFRGTIYVGLFSCPIPQGSPVRCTRLNAAGPYLLNDIPDGVYYLRCAAFPQASDLHTALLPGEKQLLGSNAQPLMLYRGQISGDPNLVLHPPRLTDPPLVMGLPLL